MSWRTLVAATLGLSSSACFLDLVDPVDIEPISEVTRLRLFVDAQEWQAGHLVLSGFLSPGAAPGGGGRTVVDPSIRLFGLSLPADSAYVDGRLVLQWEDTIMVGPAPSDILVLSFPVLSGAASAENLSVSLRREAEDSPAERVWITGTDMVLALASSSGPASVPEFSRWQLSIAGWSASIARTHVFSLSAETPVSDSIRISRVWLDASDYDSLEASIRYDRGFRTVSDDGSYDVSVTLHQRLRWLFSVAER